MKVVGSGHSHSEVAVPDDGALLIDLRNLSGGLDPYPWLPPSNDIGAAHLQRVGAGTQIRQINREVLVPKRLGLINQGPFDGQTIAGAINTNTHGSGLAMGGFADMVESMEMVVVRPRASGEVDAEIWVIEPRDGISDPATFAQLAEDRALVQDDDLFHSAVCGYGLFGVAVSYTLRVRDLYWLNEHYKPCTWRDICEAFADGGVPPLLRTNQQVKIYVNTAEWRNERPGAPATAINCRIDTWNETPLPLPEKPANWEKGALHPIFPPMRPRLDGLTKDLAGTTYDVRGSGSFTAQALNLAFFKERKQPAFYREDDILELVRQPHQDAYRNASAYYRALRRTRDNDIKYDPSLAGNKLDNTVLDGDAEPEDFGPSIEVAVPIDRMVETVECMLDLVAEQDVNFAIPTGIRFTKASEHHLCPTQGRDSAFIELVGFLPDNNGMEPRNHDWHEYRSIYKQAFNRLFHRLREQIPEVRFHLGKCNDYGAAELQADFPKFDTWREQYRLFNWTAIFDCPNARRWQLDKDVPLLSAAAVARRMDALTSPRTGASRRAGSRRE